MGCRREGPYQPQSILMGKRAWPPSEVRYTFQPIAPPSLGLGYSLNQVPEHQFRPLQPHRHAH